MNKNIIVLLVTFMVFPAIALAAANNWVVTVIQNALSMVVWPVFAGIVIIMFLWAGFLYFTAHGDPAKFKQANLTVVFAVIGIIVAILGYRIVGTVNNLIPPTPGSVPFGGACTTNADCESNNCLPDNTCGAS